MIKTKNVGNNWRESRVTESGVILVSLYMPTFPPIAREKHFESMKCIMNRFSYHISRVSNWNELIMTLNSSLNIRLSLVTIYYTNFSRQLKEREMTTRHYAFSTITIFNFNIMFTVNKLVCGGSKHEKSLS